MPVVVMYMQSALPCSTTFVSPPTIVTPALRAALPMARTSPSRTGVGSPASSTKVTTMASALRSGNGQIVHGSIYGKFADGTAGKAQRLYDEAVGGDGDRCAVEIEMGGIAEWFC